MVSFMFPVSTANRLFESPGFVLEITKIDKSPESGDLPISGLDTVDWLPLWRLVVPTVASAGANQAEPERLEGAVCVTLQRASRPLRKGRDKGTACIPAVLPTVGSSRLFACGRFTKFLDCSRNVDRVVAGTERTIATVAGRYGRAPPSAPPNGGVAVDIPRGGRGCHRGARGTTFHAAFKRDHCAGASAALARSARRATRRIGRTTGPLPGYC